ncbi:MAG: hypothetical protein KU37_09480 [Sulfuricurvum sp. PC08-66]|nr:MAG: hypothetical protein KU37_09480 [Sulfuricurvum sp. PC08-66]
MRFFISFWMFFAFAFAALSPMQLATLQAVRDEARQILDDRGESYENTLSAICLTESSAGAQLLGDFDQTLKKASLGPMQIRLSTARHVAKLTPSLNYLLAYSDQKLATVLLTNIKISTQIAAHYLVRLRNHRKSYRRAIGGYNGGWENNTYYKRVMENYRFVETLVANGQLE